MAERRSEITRGNKFAGGFGPRDYLGDYLAGRDEEFTPAVNIAENENRYKIELGLPGFEKKDFNIETESGCLTISGKKEREKSYVRDEYTRQEFDYDHFSKKFQLPDNVDEDKISARYENGLLEIEIPKKSPQKSSQKKITVS